jgi:hypothetical protein
MATRLAANLRPSGILLHLKCRVILPSGVTSR